MLTTKSTVFQSCRDIATASWVLINTMGVNMSCSRIQHCTSAGFKPRTSPPGPKVIKLFSCSTQLSMKFKFLINTEMAQINPFFWSRPSEPFILLIYVKMPTVVGILTFIRRINFSLSSAEHKKSFITSGPGVMLYR